LIADDVRSLIRLFEDSDLLELSVEHGSRKLRLRKGAASVMLDDLALRADRVGIFHSAVPPLVAGAAVSAGQVAGCIEALGVRHELVSAQAGRIAEIAVNDGQPVEYGQPILIFASSASL